MHTSLEIFLLQLKFKKKVKNKVGEITMVHASVRDNLQSWPSRAALGGNGSGEPTLSLSNLCVSTINVFCLFLSFIISLIS